ncbi:Vitamin B12 transporter btuB Cobalamin receptor [Fibrella aestuarina BUZ 2]|uniref:Vitamin B12 transporter btuB Cobalamin receptor n=1 Tax=Fibrella aestuarina BUZ 2 TaxID=1166018 RepID=I0KCK2_9BACT|nr:TonB-dependent receptor [Fibrella aestuarina]CCH01855.1 Vitamin B12 transporter btuB Cobalamin receptor [Fibrella aestuarina BUZ 2]
MKYLSLLLLLPFGANAQSDTIQLNQLTVAATRFEQPARRSPFQIQPITREQIAFRNNQNTADLLQQTGNVFVQKSQGGGGSPVLRGFEASRVLIVVDGVRMNNAIYRAGHLQNVLRIDPAILDRAEVLFGPGSTLYGSDALGGVMYFQSRNPDLSNSAKVSVRPSAYVRIGSATGERTAHADVSIGTRRLGFLTSITGASFGDVVQGNNRRADYPDFGKLTQYVEVSPSNPIGQVVTNPDPNKQVGSAYQQLDLLQKVLFQPSEGVRHILNVQYSTSSNVPRYDRLSEVASGKPRFAEWYYGPERRLLTSYRLEMTRATALFDRLNLTAAYQNIEESRNSRRLDAASLKRQVERVGVWSLNADLQKRLGDHTLQYGLELTHNDVTSTATFLDVRTSAVTPADTRYPDGGNTLSTTAFYLTDQLTLSPLVTINGGLRYTLTNLNAIFRDKTFFPFPFDEIKQSPSGLSGNLGLVLTPTERSKISLLGSTGFRAPNIDDLTKVFESRAGSLIVPNPNIRPEQTYNLELSVNQWVGNRLRLDATVFNTWFTNAIVVDAFTLNGQSTVNYGGQLSQVTAAQNKRRAMLRGYSLGALLRLTNRLSFSGTINDVAGRILAVGGFDTKELPLDHVPPTFGRLSLLYQSPRFTAEAYSLFNGWKRIADYNPEGEDNAQYATPAGMPAWMTANLRGSVRVSRFLTVQAACENLFDLNYRTFASGFSAPGRNFLLTLRAGL